MRPHLEGESPQCRNGNQDGHEESNHVVDGCQSDTRARAPQTLTHTLLPGQNRDTLSGHRGGEAQKIWQGRNSDVTAVNICQVL